MEPITTERQLRDAMNVQEHGHPECKRASLAPCPGNAL